MTAQAGDRDNFSGDITLAAPTGGVVRGNAYLINETVATARETQATTGGDFLAAISGAVQITKQTGSGETFAIGEAVYLDTATADVTPTASGNTRVGIALSVAATSDTSVLVDMQPGVAS